MDYLVEEVIDDARIGKMKCNYCGASSKVANFCCECGKSQYLQAFYLWRTKTNIGTTVDSYWSRESTAKRAIDKFLYKERVLEFSGKYCDGAK
jgi:hypothetical protein